MLRIPSVLIAALALIFSASARSWPQRPVKVMVPFAVGNSPRRIRRDDIS
jgi:tripartite-type tricarboxylate transporter receptor subunit TctC